MTQRSAGRTLRSAARTVAGPLTGAAAGLLAAAVALGVAQFVAGIIGPGGVPVIAVGSAYEVNGASVVCGNVHTANATVYIINSVMMPKS